MSKIEFHFAAISKITLVNEIGSNKSVLQATDLRLEVSRNLDAKVYLDEIGLPTMEGSLQITHALVQGLVANMRAAAANGWWKEHEHMQYIIDELQRGFVTTSEEPGVGIIEY